eukprot:CAMPEP_0117418368 /NCGR_PEP_ID=MMETSP0758-20121206/160_1 /TAXON_ID=63605 /ORGANISM="Percolomonas cosmopolitus, Strain AE-1 (ATCC 50343)" /LENGTH=273 /DNA_ID=CAMNT_0005198823 /DNA_START=811 /DNA_END=1632 /DNA_ORIENTATION=+
MSTNTQNIKNEFLKALKVVVTHPNHDLTYKERQFVLEAKNILCNLINGRHTYFSDLEQLQPQPTPSNHDWANIDELVEWILKTNSPTNAAPNIPEFYDCMNTADKERDAPIGNEENQSNTESKQHQLQLSSSGTEIQVDGWESLRGGSLETPPNKSSDFDYNTNQLDKKEGVQQEDEVMIDDSPYNQAISPFAFPSPEYNEDGKNQENTSLYEINSQDYKNTQQQKKQREIEEQKKRDQQENDRAMDDFDGNQKNNFYIQFLQSPPHEDENPS